MKKNIVSSTFCRVTIPQKEYINGEFAKGFLCQIIYSLYGSIQVWVENATGDFIVAVDAKYKDFVQAEIDKHFAQLTEGLKAYTHQYINSKRLFPGESRLIPVLTIDELEPAYNIG